MGDLIIKWLLEQNITFRFFIISDVVFIIKVFIESIFKLIKMFVPLRTIHVRFIIVFSLVCMLDILYDIFFFMPVALFVMALAIRSDKKEMIRKRNNNLNNKQKREAK
ncbi:hypothetical protein G8G12_004579 [Salmonella enterica subsp. enterica serovar Infantis]|nr:hypothetical protein [Salmonella enterica subsp. enterica serovar Infantis]EEI7812861.1 hypothetical protein [Salmonella enterica subsp. enterica serovar Infantis]EEP4469542.1 hypothetical protein [Salmonella enterica subsp. enterica serovar Infantis]EGA8812442.1 hypothetical protein [Salmonella enterica subsp. enterica serovar Infantis]EIN2391485.1 hypothetical protein [Salmonella enterica subsp. enterica serovar Infantis]